MGRRPSSRSADGEATTHVQLGFRGVGNPRRSRNPRNAGHKGSNSGGHIGDGGPVRDQARSSRKLAFFPPTKRREIWGSGTGSWGSGPRARLHQFPHHSWSVGSGNGLSRLPVPGEGGGIPGVFIGDSAFFWGEGIGSVKGDLREMFCEFIVLLGIVDHGTHFLQGCPPEGLPGALPRSGPIHGGKLDGCHVASGQLHPPSRDLFAPHAGPDLDPFDIHCMHPFRQAQAGGDLLHSGSYLLEIPVIPNRDFGAGRRDFFGGNLGRREHLFWGRKADPTRGGEDPARRLVPEARPSGLDSVFHLGSFGLYESEFALHERGRNLGPRMIQSRIPPLPAEPDFRNDNMGMEMLFIGVANDHMGEILEPQVL